MAKNIQKRIQALEQILNTHDLPSREEEVKIHLGLITEQFAICSEDNCLEDNPLVQIVQKWRSRLGTAKFNKLYAQKPATTNKTENIALSSEMSAAAQSLARKVRKTTIEGRLQQQANSAWKEKPL